MKKFRQTLMPNYVEPRIYFNRGKTYNITAWRKKILEKDTNRCRNCFNTIKDIFRGRILPNEAHHIIARRDGGKNTINNGIALCTFCHDYFDLMYSRFGLDYFQIIQKKPRVERVKEVKTLMKKRYLCYLLRIIAD